MIIKGKQQMKRFKISVLLVLSVLFLSMASSKTVYASQNPYYDMSWSIKNAGDWFRIIILIFARFYGDTDIEFSKKLYNLCEETLKMNSRFFKKFNKEKYNSYKSAFLFFEDYLNSFIEY